MLGQVCNEVGFLPLEGLVVRFSIARVGNPGEAELSHVPAFDKVQHTL